MANVDENKARVFERHGQTIIGGVILAILLWVGSTLHQVSLDTATLTERTENMQKEIAGLKALTKDRYTKQESQDDFRIRDSVLRDHAERLRALESGT